MLSMDTDHHHNHYYRSCNDNDYASEDEECNANMYDEVELEVASILLELPTLISASSDNTDSNGRWSHDELHRDDHSTSNNSSLPLWVTKKRKTSLESPPQDVTSPSSPLSPNAFHESTQCTNKRKHESSTMEIEKLKGKLMETTGQNQIYNQQIEKTKNVLEQLKAENDELRTQLEVRKMTLEKRRETQEREEKVERIAECLNNNGGDVGEGQKTPVKEEQLEPTRRRDLLFDLNVEPEMDEETMDVGIDQERIMSNNAAETNKEEKDLKSEAPAPISASTAYVFDVAATSTPAAHVSNAQQYKYNRQQRIEKMNLKKGKKTPT